MEEELPTCKGLLFNNLDPHLKGPKTQKPGGALGFALRFGVWGFGLQGLRLKISLGLKGAPVESLNVLDVCLSLSLSLCV